MWKLNNVFLNNQCIKEEIKREIKIYLHNENTAYWILSCNSSEKKVKAINAYIKKLEWTPINNLRTTSEEEQIKPEIRKRKKIIISRVEITEIEKPEKY